MGLQGLDDLHGPHLRGTGDGAAGKTASQHVQWVLALGQFTCHGADEMVDIAEALQFQKARHAHGACRAGLAQVIAQQVHDHDVLGTVLHAGDELSGQSRVLPRVLAPGPCALDGAGLHAGPAYLEETLR